MADPRASCQIRCMKTSLVESWVAGCALTFSFACTAAQQEPSGSLDALGGPAADAPADGPADVAGGAGAGPGVATDPSPSATASGGSGTSTPVDTGPTRAAADSAGVRYAGGETTDFGNGSDDLCGTDEVAEAISREEAEALGFDVASESAWLALPHRAPLSWNPFSCAELGAACADGVQISAAVTDYVLLRRSYRRPGGECPSEPTQHLAYLGAVHILTDDGQLDGTFYARLAPLPSSDGQPDGFGAQVLTDLRNFKGSLPLRLELERPHFSYLYSFFTLGRDGTTDGFLEPAVWYYDAAAGGAPISPNASWNGARGFSGYPLPSGAASTLSDYPGSLLPPLVVLSATVKPLDPSIFVDVDVDVTVSIDGQVVQDVSVPVDSILELGSHPFGTRISLDVHNAHTSSVLRVNLLQGDCTVVSSDCSELGCTAHAEHTTTQSVCRRQP
ncbi:MAG: hypothetical protein RL033_6120 [Pseudomonadota bacterium]